MNMPESKRNEVSKKLHNPLLRFLFSTQLRRGIKRPADWRVSVERASLISPSDGSVGFIGYCPDQLDHRRSPFQSAEGRTPTCRITRVVNQLK